MKSVLFVLLIRLNGDVHPAGLYESLEQCRTALTVASGNLAGTYACEHVDVRGTWAKR